MNSKESIYALDTVADILLELNDQFDIEIILDLYPYNVESDYNKIVDIFNKQNLITNLDFRIITKKGIAIDNFGYSYENRNLPIYKRRKKLISKSASFILNRFDAISNRLSSMLPGYELKITDKNTYPFLLIGVRHPNHVRKGIVKLPIFDDHVSNDDDALIMWESNVRLSSYEDDKEVIDEDEDIQLYYTYVPFEISKSKKTLKDRIKKFIDFL